MIDMPRNEVPAKDDSSQQAALEHLKCHKVTKLAEAALLAKTGG